MKLSSLFAIAILTMLGARPAYADLIENVPFSLIASSTGPVAGVVSLPQFDPASGTLNSLTLTVSGSFQFVLEDFNNGPGAVSVTALDTFSFFGVPLTAEGVFSGTIPANTTVYTFMPPPVSTSPLTESFGPNAVSPFIGTGVAPFDISILPPSVVQFSGSTTQSVLAFSGVSGSVNADFAFTPAALPTPEPRYDGEVGLGLVVIGVIARRSRRFVL